MGMRVHARMDSEQISQPEFWAKTKPDGMPGISVKDHCLNVGSVAHALLELYQRGALPSTHITWLAAAHDVGKISRGFQMKCIHWLKKYNFHGVENENKWCAAEKDHSRSSQFSIHEFLKMTLDESSSLRWAAASGMHHGSIHNNGNQPHLNDPRDEWESWRQELLADLWQEFQATSPDGRKPADADVFWVAGLISVADWIGSSFSQEPVESVSTAIVNARLKIRECGFESVSISKNKSFREIFGFEANHLQKTCIEQIKAPGLYIIEAPMGVGKTEAALGVAYQLMSNGKARGIYFALPTQATSNRIHLRVAEFLHKIHSFMPRLIHGNSWLVDDQIRFPNFSADQQPDMVRRYSSDWFASSKRALLSPFGVGTIDQSLLSVLPVKHFFVRHFALAGKVVILDEVHSYDFFTGSHVKALVDLLLEIDCTVIVLSATLSRNRRNELLKKKSAAADNFFAAPVIKEDENIELIDGFPLLSFIDESGNIKSINIENDMPDKEIIVSFFNSEDVMERVVAKAASGLCVLWICNTVDQAQATYQKILSYANHHSFETGLLHSRYTYHDREKLENHWLTALGKNGSSRPQGSVLVSTQIVEQSVDIDADLLVTELCPSDMMLQRMGRLWRHSRSTRLCSHAETWIIQEPVSLEEMRELSVKSICENLGNKAYVYHPYVLIRTLEIFSNIRHLTLPRDIRPLMDATYSKKTGEPSAWQELRNALETKKNKLESSAASLHQLWTKNPMEDREDLCTRLNEQKSIPLLLCRSVKNRVMTLWDYSEITIGEPLFQIDTARALHRNTVKIPLYWLNSSQLLSDLTLQQSNFIGMYFQDQWTLGLCELDHIVCSAILPSFSLAYRSHLGLIRVKLAVSKNYNDPLDDIELYEPL